jgi:tetratricopeptide (TPR) repeat protein
MPGKRAAEWGPPASPLAGRRDQWEALLAAYQAVTGHGHLVIIEGEAGVGKTRLAQALLAHVRQLGGTAAAGTGYAGEEALAYAPVEQLLRQALEAPGAHTRLAGVEPPWQQALRRLLPELQGPPMPPPHEASGSQAHFLEGITRALGGLLHGPHPGVVLLDDLHNADSATLDLLTYMVRRLHALPLLVIATWCTDEVPPNHRLRQMAAEAARRQAATVLVLPPLDLPAIFELLAAWEVGAGSGRRLAQNQQQSLAERLFRETRGLPLFVVEYLDLLRRGALDPLAALWPAPQGVRQFLYARMGGLSETAQQLVSTAAVIGRSFDMGTVIAASGRSEEEGVNALEELLARRLILEQGADSFDFSHAQLRSLIYEETSQVRRRLLHRRVAEALAMEARRSGVGSAGVAAALAQHYELAGVDDKAAHWAVTAGEHARKVYANREAVRYFEKALALGAADTCAIHLHLGDLHTLQGEYSQALDSYRLARQACDSKGGEIGAVNGDIEHRLGRLHQRLGDGAQAARHFATALQCLSAASAGQRAVVLADWSLAAYAMHDMDRAVELAQAALAQANTDIGQPFPARAYDILSLVARQRNDLPAAIEQAQRSLAAARRLNDPAAEMAALNSLALAHAAAGAEAEAIPLVQAALELCVRLGDRHHEAALHNNLADLYHACGQPDAAMHQLKQAVAIFAEVGAEAGPDNAEIWMLSEW